MGPSIFRAGRLWFLVYGWAIFDFFYHFPSPFWGQLRSMLRLDFVGVQGALGNLIEYRDSLWRLTKHFAYLPLKSENSRPEFYRNPRRKLDRKELNPSERASLPFYFQLFSDRMNCFVSSILCFFIFGFFGSTYFRLCIIYVVFEFNSPYIDFRWKWI